MALRRFLQPRPVLAVEQAPPGRQGRKPGQTNISTRMKQAATAASASFMRAWRTAPAASSTAGPTSNEAPTGATSPMDVDATPAPAPASGTAAVQPPTPTHAERVGSAPAPAATGASAEKKLPAVKRRRTQWSEDQKEVVRDYHLSQPASKRSLQETAKHFTARSTNRTSCYSLMEPDIVFGRALMVQPALTFAPVISSLGRLKLELQHQQEHGEQVDQTEGQGELESGRKTRPFTCCPRV